jgi:two-component system chemotaxis response regulator CheB
MNPDQSGTSAGSSPPVRRHDYRLRRFSTTAPQALVIAASTGGTQALLTLLRSATHYISRLPVFIVLHVQASFTSSIIAQIQSSTGLPVRVPAHGEGPKPGELYLAPGNLHMRLLRMGDMPVICHADLPPENFCKPSADVLFRSAAQTYGAGTLAVVLTGMGADGLVGARAVVEAGGSVIVQDEATSVVWGMPGAVAEDGLAAAIQPIDKLGQTIASLILRTATRGAA